MFDASAVARRLLPSLVLLACSDDAAPPTVITATAGAAGVGGTAGAAGGGGVTAAGQAGQGGGKGGAPVGGQSGQPAGAAGTSGGAPAGGAPSALPARYPNGRTHSPLTASVVSRLQTLLAASPQRKDVFAKVGASNTVSPGFSACFAGADVRLDAHAALAPTIDYFKKTLADGAKTSFDRVTLAATVGWGAAKTLEGTPPPIDAEVAAIHPAFAVVLLGTNDTYDAGVVPFDQSMEAVVDRLSSLGVVPIVTTIPPRRDTATARALVPEMNAILRAIAEEKQVPFVDLFSILDAMPTAGVGSDGIHMPAYVSNGTHGCWFDADGLTAGMNQRNLVTLEALDRMRRLVEGTLTADADTAPVQGAGTFADPIVVDALPFVHHADTSKAPPSAASKYSCGTQDEGGAEVVYRVTLAKPAKISVRVFDGAAADVDLHWLTAPSPDACQARDDRHLVIDAPAGDGFLAVDTFVSNGKPAAGRYRLTIVPVD